MAGSPVRIHDFKISPSRLRLLLAPPLYTSMMTFMEFLSRRTPSPLDPLTLANRLGIDLFGPHEIEVQRLKKALKKAAERAPKKAAAGGALVGLVKAR